MASETEKERRRDRLKRRWKHIFQSEDSDDSAAGPSSVKHDDVSADHATKDSPSADMPVKEDLNESSDTSRQSLWGRALKEVQKDEDFKKYQEAVAPSQKPLDDLSPEYLSQIQKTAKELLDKLPDSYLTFKFGHGDEHKFVVRKQVRKVVKVVLTCKDVIGQAINAEPHASLIWAGVLVVLPILENIFQQDDDAASGFGQLSSELVRLQAIEEALFSPSKAEKSKPKYADLAADLEKSMVEVYAAIYRYQIQIVLHYVQKKARRTVENLTSTDWKAMAQTAATKIGNIDQKFHVLFGSRMIETTNHLLERVDKMVKLQERTLEHVLEAEQSRLFSELPCVGDAIFNSEANKQQETCLKGTQRETLKGIQEWRDNPDGKLVFWLHGLAGTGKSSISKTVAMCLDKGWVMGTEDVLPRGTYLGASFFLKQGDSKRNHLLEFFPTIAVLMAQQSPALKKHIASAIQNDRTIPKKLLSEQLDKLILKPLVELEAETPLPIRLFVVVDALDECKDKANAKEMLQLLPRLASLKRVQIRIFITSRPLDHIKDAMPSAVVESVTLEKIPQHKLGDPNTDDITLLITTRMEEIVSEAHLAPAGWISQEEIADLVAKSDGLFIYAATLCRFLSAHIPPKTRQTRMIRMLQGTSNSDNSPEAKLSEIYLHVLSFPFTELEGKEKMVKYAAVKKILGFIALVYRPVSITALANLLQQDQESVRQDLDEIYSIVSVPNDESGTIEFFHLSFRDYLLDEKRSAPHFWVDEKATHRLLFDACLRVMEAELHQDMCSLHFPGSLAANISPETIRKGVSPQLQYSCLHCVRHLAELDEAHQREAGLTDNGRVHAFLSTKFLFWLETLSLTGMMSDSIRILKTLQNLANVSATLTGPGSTSQLCLLINDASRFTRSFRQIISKAPPQTYSSALVFSPTKSIVRNTFQHLIPPWVVRASNLEEEWSPQLYALEGHTDRIRSLAVSPDNATIASAGEDHTIRLWDLETGAEILCIDNKIRRAFRSVSFLPDGQTIVYALENGQIGLRNILNGKTTTLDSHHDQIYGTVSAFSYFYGINLSKNLRIWNAETETYLETVQLENNISRGCISRVYISIAGGFLVLGYNAFILGSSSKTCGGVVLWSLEDQKVVHKSNLDYHVCGIALSNCATFLVIVSSGGFEVLDAKTGTLQWKENLQFNIWSLATSPDSPVLAVGTENGFITMYNLSREATEPIRKFRAAGEASPITALQFSTNGLLISATSENVVQVWDMTTHFDSRHAADSVTCIQELSHTESTFLIWRGSNLEVWDLKTNTSRPLVRDAWIISLDDSSISPDGRILALMADYDGSTKPPPRNIEFRDDTLALLQAFDDVRAYRFSGDSQMVALENESTLRILHTDTWKIEAVLESSWVNGAAEFSADNRLFAWVSEADSKYHLQVRDLEAEKTVLDVLCKITSQFSLSPDGSLVAFCPVGSDGQHILDIQTGHRRFILEAYSVQFDRQMRNVLYISNNPYCADMFMADLTSGDTIHTFYMDKTFQHSRYDEMETSPSGKVMRYVTRFKYVIGIQTWDANFKEIGTYKPDANPINLHFSDDETHLVGSIGRLPLQSATTYRSSGSFPEEVRRCMYVGNQWVIQGFENLLWLPPAYRVGSSRMVVRDGTIVMGLPSGKLAILELDLEKTPLPC